MKIAYFITGLGLGGAEIITIDLAQKAIRAGHEVIIVYLTDIGTLASKIPSEIPVFPLHLQKKTVAIHSGSGKSEEHHQAISS